ncbi:MAG: hypothetical protein AB1458_07505 [Bacteroidota bacterium]
MTPLENLHYAIGQLAYAVAHIDGRVQKEERQKFHDIVLAELRGGDYAFDISDIIFQILDKDKQDAATAYDWAIKEFRLNSHYLSPELKGVFTRILEMIAKAYPPVLQEERDLIDRFKKEMASLKGDPTYYK